MPLITFVMRFYSMSFNDVMNLRFKTFMALNREANKLQAKEYLQDLAIALTPRQDTKYYKSLWNMYNGILNPKSKELPPTPIRPAIDAASVQGKNAVINLFARGRPGGR